MFDYQFHIRNEQIFSTFREEIYIVSRSLIEIQDLYHRAHISSLINERDKKYSAKLRKQLCYREYFTKTSNSNI